MLYGILLSMTIMLPTVTEAALAKSPAIDLKVERFHHITFPKIPPNRFGNEGETLVITVEQSSSFLLLPYEKPRSVEGVRFLWKSAGDLKVPDAATEQKKAGDDGRLRVGLLLQGKAPLLPFFAPRWIKTIRDIMKVPSNEILYLAVGTRNAPMTQWTSPYADDIKIMTLPAEAQADGWQVSEMNFISPMQVVGIWLTADGDDTQSTFKTWLKDLVLDENK